MRYNIFAEADRYSAEAAISSLNSVLPALRLAMNKVAFSKYSAAGTASTKKFSLVKLYNICVAIASGAGAELSSSSGRVGKNEYLCKFTAGSYVFTIDIIENYAGYCVVTVDMDHTSNFTFR